MRRAFARVEQPYAQAIQDAPGRMISTPRMGLVSPKKIPR